MRNAFSDELISIEALLVRMADTVRTRLDDAVSSLKTLNIELAQQVVDGDDVIDEGYMEARSRIFMLIARQAPVASDLRLVAAMLHINIHLERMGDLCVTIGKIVKIVAEMPTEAGILDEISEMGSRSGGLLQSAMNAFVERDVEGALLLSGLDDPVDRLNRRVLKHAMAFASADEAALEWTMRMILVARQLERFGDHAVDIGEEVAFLVTGEFQEFTDASHKADTGPIYL